MIQNSFYIFIFLIVLEIVIVRTSVHPTTKRFFAVLPSVFWIYALPMFFSNIGVLASKSALYGLSVTYALPVSLIVLLIGVDVKAITRLGRVGLSMFLAGSVGIMIGTVVVFAVIQNMIGQQFWSGFSALSGSWMGGSANMVAVKEALGTPDDIFAPMVIVDTIVPYVWMGLLVLISTKQKAIDRWSQADRAHLDHIQSHLKRQEIKEKQKNHVGVMLGIGCIASVCTLFTHYVSSFLPVISGVVSQFTWVIIMSSLIGLGLSFTRLNRAVHFGTDSLGYFVLYFVLMTIGAKASIAHLQSSLILIAAGFVIVLIHACVLVAVMKWMRAPVMIAAAASQANIGGVASAPLVAEIYQPGLSTIGLLMAIFGNIVGTYLGIGIGQILRMIGGG